MISPRPTALAASFLALTGFAAATAAQSPAIPEWVDACDVAEIEVRKLFGSECAVIRKSALGQAKDGSYFLIADSFTYERGGHPEDDAYCPSAQFYGQPRAAGDFPGRSGLLVGEDLVLTAAHTITGDPAVACASLFYFVFDYRYDSGPGGTCLPPDIQRIPAENVYECKAILRNGLTQDGGLDFLLVQLDRPVSGNRQPLRVRRSGAPAVGDRVVFLAHPDQLPAKVSLAGAYVGLDLSAPPHLLFSGVHGMGGSSGGMFYNLERDLVESVLIFTGCPDFVETAEGCSVLLEQNCSEALGSQIVPFAAHVPPGEELLVSPLDLVVHDGPVGGPVTSPVSVYTLSVPASASGPIAFEITDPLEGASTLVATPGLDYTLELPAGRIESVLFPGESATLTTFASAGPAPAGTQSLRLILTNDANPFRDELHHRFELGFTEFQVTPAVGFRAGGVVPPYTQSQTYTVRNTRSQPVSVRVSADSPWITLAQGQVGGESAQRTLDFTLGPAGTAGDAREVLVAIGPAADALPTGLHVGAVEFHNVAGGSLDLGTTVRAVHLNVSRGDYRSLRFGVPDGDPEGVLIPIEATEVLDVCDLDLAVASSVATEADGPGSIDASQLQITLISPSGTRVLAWDHDKGTFNLVLFDDEGTPLPTGQLLSAFDGEPALGTWILHVIDDVPGDAFLVNALISIEPPRPTCPP